LTKASASSLHDLNPTEVSRIYKALADHAEEAGKGTMFHNLVVQKLTDAIERGRGE
jgi:hypothetical protein